MKEQAPPLLTRFPKLLGLTLALWLSAPAASGQARTEGERPGQMPAARRAGPSAAAHTTAPTTGQSVAGELRKKHQELDTLVDEVGDLVNGLSGSSPPEAFEEALRKARKGLELSREVKSHAGESLSLFLLARVYEEKKEWPASIEHYRKSLQLLADAKAAGTPAAVAQAIKEAELIALRNMGRTYVSQGAYEEALQPLSQALALCGEGEEKGIKASILRYLGDSQKELKMTSQAEASYLKAREIFESQGLPLDVGIVSNRLGSLYYFHDGDRLADALKNFLKAEESLKQSPPKSSYQDSRIWNLYSIGAAYLRLNEPTSAFEYVNKARELRGNILSQENFIFDYFTRGRELDDAGRDAEALATYGAALDLAGQAEPEVKSMIWVEIAFIHYRAERNDEGLKAMKQALAAVEHLEDKGPMAHVFERVGDASFHGHFNYAAEFYRRGLIILQSTDNNKLWMRNTEEAARLLGKLGRAQLEQGDTSNAWVNLRTSLAVRMSFSDKVGLSEGLHDHMTSFAKIGKGRLAILYGKLGVLLRQEIRGSLKTLPVETQRSFLKGSRGTYETLAELLIKEGRLGEAQQIINRYQSQEFFDFGGNGNQTADEISLTPRERAARAELQQFEARLKSFAEVAQGINTRTKSRPPTEQEIQEFNKTKSLLVGTAGELEAKLRQIESDFSRPPDETDRVAAVPDELEMRAALRELGAATGQKAAALYTLIGRDKFYLLLVNPDGAVKVFESPVRADALDEKILEFYALLQSPAYDPRPAGKELYDVVFRPAEAELKKTGARALLWMLDGTLRYVPVSALWDGKDYLIRRYQNLVLTRASRERMTRGVSRRWAGTGFGSSRAHTVDLLGDGNEVGFSALPGVTQELQSVFRTDGADAGVLDGDVYFDGQFTRDAFYRAVRRRRPLVHVASHFSFRPGDDSRSFMLLGDGAVLPLSEMKKQEGLFEGVELLTLSACNTAATRPDARGREIDGFAELAQRLGAHAVMATLWQVSDNSTPWLMREFYVSREHQAGLTKAEALRRAQLALLEGRAAMNSSSDLGQRGVVGNFKLAVLPEGAKRPLSNTRADIIYVEARNAPPFNVDERKPFAHPYFWSPFVLYGNGR